MQIYLRNGLIIAPPQQKVFNYLKQMWVCQYIYKKEQTTNACNDYTSVQVFLKSIPRERSQTQRPQVYEFVYIMLRRGQTFKMNMYVHVGTIWDGNFYNWLCHWWLNTIYYRALDIFCTLLFNIYAICVWIENTRYLPCIAELTLYNFSKIYYQPHSKQFLCASINRKE